LTPIPPAMTMVFPSLALNAFSNEMGDVGSSATSKPWLRAAEVTSLSWTVVAFFYCCI
jgi:hypothetical protein